MARTPVHVGEILAEELEVRGLTAARLAEVPANRRYRMLAG